MGSGASAQIFEKGMAVIMNLLKAGFGRVNVNPPMGIAISGYFIPRFAEAVLDDLEVTSKKKQGCRIVGKKQLKRYG